MLRKGKVLSEGLKQQTLKGASLFFYFTIIDYKSDIWQRWYSSSLENPNDKEQENGGLSMAHALLSLPAPTVESRASTI